METSNHYYYYYSTVDKSLSTSWIAAFYLIYIFGNLSMAECINIFSNIEQRNLQL